jgi:branched-subunit amino acid transport protein
MRLEMASLFLGMAAVTFFTRFGSQVLFRQVGMPRWFERWLKHVPTGILTTLIVPSVFLPKGSLDISLGNPYLIAGLIAAIVAYKFQKTVVTMGLGLITVVFLRWTGW